MNILINQEPRELADAMHLDVLLDQLQPKKPFAISVNSQFISKAYYASTLVQENDVIEIISPVTGG
jgi:sulfur carrier protein